MQVLNYHEAIFASNLSSNAKLTALAIASYYNWKEDSMCWPSNKTLAECTGLSISTVVRAKKELVSQTYLQVWRRIDNSNMYRPLLPQNISIVSKNRGSDQIEQRVYAERPTNNEYNNEVNNETKNEINNDIKVDSFQSSTFGNNINNLNRGGLDDVWEIYERTDRRRQGAPGRNYQVNRQNNKRSRTNEDINAAVPEFNQTVAEIQGQEW